MFGIGTFEMLFLGLMCFGVLIVGVLVAVVVVLTTRGGDRRP
ncbi:MAG: hypothetical protein SFU86_12605 [Pirellulaceae bacterium]|nr:hypothetical protein [Pirellulaceae bacterium]